MRLSPHFSVAEAVPASIRTADVPPEIIVNLQALCENILEPLRAALGHPIDIHDGWRPAAHNAAVGGVKHSDHLTGNAIDFHVASPDRPTDTLRAFHWIREHLAGKYGQLMLEDHRNFLRDPKKLWIHVSNPTPRHPGMADHNSLLVSHQPGVYLKWNENLA